jgi:hypothetical protein
MKTSLLPYLFAILAGFALLRVPIGSTFLSSLEQVFDVVGVLAVLLFSIVLIIVAIQYLFKHKL